MTITDFMDNIEERFGKPSKDIHNTDIIELLKALTDEEREKLWTLFLNHYNLQRPPKRGDFHRIMRDYNIKERIFSDKWKYYYICDECQQPYNMESRACPKCKTWARKLYQAEHYPGDMMWAHVDCYRCKRYTPKLYCPHWGKKEGQVYPQCATCSCKICCRAERLSKYDYQLYRQLLRDQPETVDVDEVVEKLVKKHKFHKEEIDDKSESIQDPDRDV